MKKLTIIIFIVLISSYTNGQSGFLGSTVNVSASFGTAPIIRNMFQSSNGIAYNKVSKLDTISHRVWYKKATMRYQYSFDINKVIFDKIQLGFNYGFQKINITGEQVLYADTSINNGYGTNNGKIVNDIPLTNNSYTFRFKWFYAGIAPIGKFWGLDLSLSTAKTSETIPLEYARTTSYYGNSLFGTKYYLDNTSNIHKDTLNFGSKIKTFSFKFLYGRTIPITEKIGLDLSLIIPLINIQFYDSYPHIRRSYQSSISFEEETFYQKRDFNNIISKHLRYNQGYTFNIGIRYFI